jgi:hypothetical protein
VSPARAAPLALPHARDGTRYDSLADVAAARELFVFAAAPCPTAPDAELAWGAWADDSRLVGALLAERRGWAALLFGPIVREHTRALDVAAELVAIATSRSGIAGVDTLFARPQGLDRIWVRFGFIPVPEGTLPAGLRGHPGAGLFAYRGGSAMWSAERPSLASRASPVGHPSSGPDGGRI